MSAWCGSVSKKELLPRTRNLFAIFLARESVHASRMTAQGLIDRRQGLRAPDRVKVVHGQVDQALSATHEKIYNTFLYMAKVLEPASMPSTVLVLSSHSTHHWSLFLMSRCCTRCKRLTESRTRKVRSACWSGWSTSSTSGNDGNFGFVGQTKCGARRQSD